MPGRFDPEDFVSLALSLRQTVANHGVSPRLRASLIEDVIFQFAVFVDERTGSAIHESIFSVLRKHARSLASTPGIEDPLLAEVEVKLRKGRKAELNVLRSSLKKPRMLRLIVEIALGLRDTTEIAARVDTESRFADLMKKKGGIAAVRFKIAGGGPGKWEEVAPNRSPYGRFDESLEGLLACISTVVACESKSRGREDRFRVGR